MSRFLNLINGNKTYIVAAIFSVAYFFLQIDVISEEMFEIILNLDGAAALVALRSALKKLES